MGALIALRLGFHDAPLEVRRLRFFPWRGKRFSLKPVKSISCLLPARRKVRAAPSHRVDHRALTGRPDVQLWIIDLPRALSMSFLAANPADFPHLFPCLVEQANARPSDAQRRWRWHPSYGGHACLNRTAIAANFRSQCADENFALGRVCRYVSRLLLGHRFGAFPAPGGTRSSASRSAPLRGLGSSQNKFEYHGKERRANFFRAPPRKQTFDLGSRAHSLGFARCDPSNNGKFNKRRHDHHVHQQSNPHGLHRQRCGRAHQ